METHVEDDVAIGRLEERVAIGERAVGRGQRAHGLVVAVPDPDPSDRLGDFLPIGADVLDGGGTGRSRDAREGLDPRPPLGHGTRDDLVPHLPRSHPDEGASAGVARLDLDPLGRDLHDGAFKARVSDHEIRSATEHEQWLVSVIHLADDVDDRIDRLSPHESLSRTPDPHRRVGSERLVEGLAHQGLCFRGRIR